jgi:hypothetical protein
MILTRVLLAALKCFGKAMARNLGEGLHGDDDTGDAAGSASDDEA